MRKSIMTPALCALSLALAACATQPNPNLDQARADVQQLQANPQATSMAQKETRDAVDALSRAEKAYDGDADRVEVDQLAYLASQRAAVAEQTIRMRTAEETLKGAELERTRAQLEARESQISGLLEQLKPKQTERGTVITLGDVLFAFDSASLTSTGMQNVQQLANALQQEPERKVLVEGFTDSVGSDSYNMQLSQRRADAVKAALIRMGVDPQRITALGQGEGYPVASNSNPSDRALNRRVEVTISNDAKPVQPRRVISNG